MRIILWLSVLGLILCSVGCRSTKTFEEDEVTGETWTLSRSEQVNPSDTPVRTGSYTRTSGLFVGPDGKPFIMWTPDGARAMVIQSIDTTTHLPSKPLPLFKNIDGWLDHPTMAFDAAKGLTFAAAWQKRAGGDKYVVFVRSQDKGVTWSDPQIISRGGGAFAPEMIYDGQGSLYVVWKDERDGFADLYFNRSKDEGRTWLEEDVRLSPGKPAAGIATSHMLQCEPNGQVQLAFTYTPEGETGAIYFRTSSDYGEKWSAPVRVNDNPELHMDFPQFVRTRDGRLAISWIFIGDRSFAALYMDASSDGGRTWGEDRIIYSNTPSALAYLNMFGWNNEDLLLLWVDRLETNITLLYNISQDFGATWSGGDNAGGSIPTEADHRPVDVQIRTDQRGIVVAAWRELGADRSLVRASFSLDRGVTWLKESITMSPKNPGKYHYALPQVAIHGDSVSFLYTRADPDSGNSDIFYRRLEMTEAGAGQTTSDSKP